MKISQEDGILQWWAKVN